MEKYKFPEFWEKFYVFRVSDTKRKGLTKSW